MKRIFCVVLASSFMALVSNAQQTQFGLKAGANIASVGVDDGDDYDSKAGFHVGGLAHIHITQHFAVQPELTYSAQGGKDGDNLKLKLNYINIPVLAQYMTLDGFRFETGPQIGFLASAKRKVNDVEFDVKDDLESLDFSWAFGVGYLFPGANGLGVDVRYNLGISNISEDNTYQARNRVFQIGLFYQFMHAAGQHRHRR
jgi:hypothetical protein